MNSIDKRHIKFVVFILLFSVVLFAYNFESAVSGYNATLLGLTYENGILPRAFIGTIYGLLNHILPFDLYTYGCVKIFVFLITVCFILFFTISLIFFIKKTQEDLREYIEYVMVFITIFLVGTFTSFYNYGRLDLYMVMLSILAALLVVFEKCEWLLIPISVVGVLIHEGYVFMYYNVILILLLYKIIKNYQSNNKKALKKYIIILAISVVLVCVVFSYYTFVYDGNIRAYDDSVRIAKLLSYNGEYHEEVIRAEVLGENLFEEEWRAYHIGNFVETAFFVVLFLPFIIIAFSFFRKLFKKCNSKIEKAKYVFIAIGALTTLPLFILKVDFGRWILAVLVYYSLVVIALLAMNDEKVRDAWTEEIDNIHSKTSIGKLLFVYAMLFVPLLDVNICGVTGKMLDFVKHIF